MVGEEEAMSEFLSGSEGEGSDVEMSGEGSDSGSEGEVEQDLSSIRGLLCAAQTQPIEGRVVRLLTERLDEVGTHVE
ncbi:hypothetical protein KIPB_016174 [Kipferlia bialata]|uniref:Uncharacterized protein n=1 Tax=Kipferlia bialata TaxID=797122 RepID=A0A391NZ09_9EUKA|nr:hypothetical protein KIPB_016174 [Kipferlia bialata]|eukprot:g16174.t1